MIVISIPVKDHIKKYLIKRYGATHQISKKSFIGIFLLEILEKKVEKPFKDVNCKNSYELMVPEFYFNKKGYSVDAKKLKLLSICLERLFMEDFYHFMDAEMIKPAPNAKKSIKLFFIIYDIHEDELRLDSMYRNYQRFSSEKIKQKKRVIVIK